MKRFQRFVVGDGGVGRSLDVLEKAMLRSDAWVVQPSGDAVGLSHLPMLVLEQVGFGAVEDAYRASDQACRVLMAIEAQSACLDTDELHGGVFQHRMKQSDSVAAPTDASDGIVRQPTNLVKKLGSGLDADDGFGSLRNLRLSARFDTFIAGSFTTYTTLQDDSIWTNSTLDQPFETFLLLFDSERPFRIVDAEDDKSDLTAKKADLLFRRSSEAEEFGHLFAEFQESLAEAI